MCTCGSTSLTPYTFAGVGTIVSFTTVTTAGPEFDQTTPYILALIDLDEGVRVLGQLTDVDVENLTIGARVTTTFRRLHTDGKNGIINYGVKFILITTP
jgi:uncharacterized OB-fold protein